MRFTGTDAEINLATARPEFDAWEWISLLLRRLPGAELAQVLVTLGLSFMIVDACLLGWGGDPIAIATPTELRGASRLAGLA